MIKVLFCGLKYEYGDPKRGLSFEYQNFYQVLRDMENVQADLFAIDEMLEQVGRDALNAKLIYEVERQNYDLLFCFLFTEELKKETIEYITKKTRTKTFNWFADDHWRFHIFSKAWAPLFTAIGTTDTEALAKYRKLGIKKVIKTQWGANTRLYRPDGLDEAEVLELGEKLKNLEITFVGQNYSVRQGYINALERAGLPVTAFGTGFPGGGIPKQLSARIWRGSKINLNFTESNYYGFKSYAKLFAKLFVKKQLKKYRFDAHNIFNNTRSALSVRRRQIKSRNFEIPACGGFLLTGDADNLSEYYVPGKEIVIFKDKRDLLEKCRYYLAHRQERENIALAGYQRTIKEHSYDRRFKEIFKAMELI